MGEERDSCLWPRRQFLNHNPLKIFNYTGIVSLLMHSALTRNVHRLHLRTHPLMRYKARVIAVDVCVMREHGIPHTRWNIAHTAIGPLVK